MPMHTHTTTHTHTHTHTRTHTHSYSHTMSELRYDQGRMRAKGLLKEKQRETQERGERRGERGEGEGATLLYAVGLRRIRFFECMLLAPAAVAVVAVRRARILRFHSFLWLPFDATKYATKFYFQSCSCNCSG